MDALLNAVIADLYDGVFQIGFQDYCRFALEQSNRVVERDRMLWTTSIVATYTLLNITLINMDPEGLKVYQQRFLHRDRLLERAVEGPNIPIRYEDVAADRESGMLFGVDGVVADLPHMFAQIMVTASKDDTTSISEVHAQYRDDPGRPFTDRERELYRLLFPHMNAGWRHRQLLKLYEENPGGLTGQRYGRRGNAVVSASGMIEVADSLFSRRMLDLFKDWRGPFLPPALTDFLDSGSGSLLVGGLEFRLTRGERHILSVSEAVAGDALTPAERRVADLFAEGHSYSLVARRLGVSKSTVRNQISAIYRKLDIHSKVELVRVSRQA